MFKKSNEIQDKHWRVGKTIRVAFGTCDGTLYECHNAQPWREDAVWIKAGDFSKKTWMVCPKEEIL